MEETTINISLNDEKSKYIAEVIGNETCKKILNLLAEKELTETEISQSLKIPLNTVDYNIKKLVKSGLIESSSHWWSAKGKKMPSYKISNKQIIISPRKLSSKVMLIPSLIVGGLISLGVKLFSEKQIQDAPMLMAKSADMAAEAMTLAEPAAEVSRNTIQATASFSIAGWEWFLIGIWSGIILFFVLSYLFETKFSRRSK